MQGVFGINALARLDGGSLSIDYDITLFSTMLPAHLIINTDVGTCENEWKGTRELGQLHPTARSAESYRAGQLKQFNSA